MTKAFKFAAAIMIFAVSGCSQIEYVVFLNRSGSDSLFAFSESGEPTKLAFNTELVSWRILRYRSPALIKLKADGTVYEYGETAILTPHWTHYASRAEIVLCLLKNMKIYVCDPVTKKLLEPQPEGLPLVPLKK